MADIDSGFFHVIPLDKPQPVNLDGQWADISLYMR